MNIRSLNSGIAPQLACGAGEEIDGVPPQPPRTAQSLCSLPAVLLDRVFDFTGPAYLRLESVSKSFRARFKGDREHHDILKHRIQKQEIFDAMPSHPQTMLCLAHPLTTDDERSRILEKVRLTPRELVQCLLNPQIGESTHPKLVRKFLQAPGSRNYFENLRVRYTWKSLPRDQFSLLHSLLQTDPLYGAWREPPLSERYRLWAHPDPNVSSVYAAQQSQFLRNAPQHILNQYELVKLSICKDGAEIQYLPPTIITPELCELAVGKNYFCSHNIQYVPEEFLSEKLCAAAASEAGNTIQHIPEKLRTLHVCTQAVNNNGEALRWVPWDLLFDDDPVSKKAAERLCTMAVENNPRAIRYVPDSFLSETLCETAVLAEGFTIVYIPERYKTQRVCNAAARSDARAAAYLPKGRFSRA